MASKSQVAIILSKLNVFDNPNVDFEQYPTDSEIAADVLNFGVLKGDINEMVVADFGCGTGILGIGALLMGAKKVYFIDRDEHALTLLKKNLENFEFENYEILHKNINNLTESDLKESIDTVIQNPPFGTKDKHADKAFLAAAFSFSPVVYSFHKTNTKVFLSAFSKDSRFKFTNQFNYEFPLKKAYEFHKKHIHRIEVSCFRFEKE